MSTSLASYSTDLYLWKGSGKGISNWTVSSNHLRSPYNLMELKLHLVFTFSMVSRPPDIIFNKVSSPALLVLSLYRVAILSLNHICDGQRDLNDFEWLRLPPWIVWSNLQIGFCLLSSSCRRYKTWFCLIDIAKDCLFDWVLLALKLSRRRQHLLHAAL